MSGFRVDPFEITNTLELSLIYFSVSASPWVLFQNISLFFKKVFKTWTTSDECQIQVEKSLVDFKVPTKNTLTVIVKYFLGKCGSLC